MPCGLRNSVTIGHPQSFSAKWFLDDRRVSSVKLLIINNYYLLNNVVISVCMYCWSASRSDQSLQRRQLEAVATLSGLNHRPVDVPRLSSNTSLCAATNTRIVLRCPLILIHFSQPFSTSHHQLKGKISGHKVGSGGGAGRSDGTGGDKGASTVLCPCCGHACSKTEVFMCTLQRSHARYFLCVLRVY